MKYAKTLKRATTGALIASGLLLSACGSDSSNTSSGGSTPASTSSTVSGVAATGAPLAGGSIVLHCQNSWNEGATADSNGAWSIAVPSANLPCAVKATPAGGGQSYYSFTLSSGSSVVTNVTPLTSLALAKTGITPDDAWFNALNDGGRQALATSIASAITALKTALDNAGYTLPSGFNPFNVTFTASAGNAYDDLLEAIKAALADASTDLPTLLASVASGGNLPDAPEEEPAPTCSSGNNKLVFTGGPSGFCGFTREASANTIENYYQFTSTAGSHGTTYVKFTLTSNGSAVQSVMIENDDYAFNCGSGSATTCSGVTFSDVSGGRQFNLSGTTLGVVFGGTQSLVVNGNLVHTTGSSSGGTGGSDTIATPTLESGEFGLRFASNGTINAVAEEGVQRFWSDHGGISVGIGDSAGLLTESYLTISSPFSSFGLNNLPNTPGTYDCGYSLGSLNPRNISLAYGVGQGYSSIGTRGVSGFSCSITITSVGSTSGSNYSGALAGNFKARLFKTGAPVSLATSIVVSGSFRLGN